MPTKRKTETDTPAQATAEVTAAHRRIILSTAKEDRWKCGLEYIGRRLDDARACAEAAAARILPDVADVKLNPAPTLASLCATPPKWQPAVKLSELCELIFAQLQKEIALKPDVELLYYHGNKRLETFASDWFVFLFGWNNCSGCFALMQKKIALARALGKHGAADKLDEAFRQIMPAFALTDCGDKDAERFAAEITPDNFHAAFRNALKLDAEATDEINAQPGATVNVVKPPRTDAGGTHGKTARGWRTQEYMAADFSKSAKKIRGKWYGNVTVARVKDWETRYPNEARRERKSGYHAGLRNVPNPTPETKKAYWEAVANWNDYWKKHNEAFLAWLETNPKGDHATFLKTWERPGKTVRRNDTDKTMRYGADTSLPDALDSGDFDNET